MQCRVTSALAAYSREQRTQADVRFPAASSDSTFQRCLFIGDKLKPFSPPPSSLVCVWLNNKAFQGREMHWSGVLLGMKSMSGCTPTYTLPTDLQIFPYPLPRETHCEVWSFIFFCEAARDWVWRIKSLTDLINSTLNTFLYIVFNLQTSSSHRRRILNPFLVIDREHRAWRGHLGALKAFPVGNSKKFRGWHRILAW